MTTKKVTRSKTQGKVAKAPAKVLREQRAKLDEASRVPVPKPSTGPEHPATTAARDSGEARAVLGALVVPLTLGKLCRIIGPDVKPERFGSTALLSLAIQLEGIESIAEQDNTGMYDRWCCVENIVDRMRLAANVAEWLDSETHPSELREVEP